MRKPLLFDTQNPEISGFSTAHAYNYKTKRHAKMKQDREKWHFCWLITILPMYLKSRGLRTDHERRDVCCSVTHTNLNTVIIVLYESVWSVGLSDYNWNPSSLNNIKIYCQMEKELSSWYVPRFIQESFRELRRLSLISWN